MGEPHRQLVWALLVATATVTGCSTNPEVVEFQLEASDLDQSAVDDLAGDVLEGGWTAEEARHLGWVAGPDGRVDVVDTVEVDSDGMQHQCRRALTDRSSNSHCGETSLAAGQLLRVNVTRWDDAYSAAHITVGDGVRDVQAVAADGTVYTVTPLDGVGYLEWKASRGDLTVTARDASGGELETLVAEVRES